jgi:indolepyruvate ferredoxin oxidoreductase alpha subunit
MAYNPPPTGHLVMILDNETTAMTGQQEHPGTGRALDHTRAYRMDFAAVARAMGIAHVELIDESAKDVDLKARIAACLARDETALMIVRQPCVLAAPKIRLYEKAADHQCAAAPAA